MLDSVHVRQFVKFGIVGVMNTVIDVSIFFLGTRYGGLHYLSANVISWTCAVFFSFTVNKFWTFRAVAPGAAMQQYVRFVIVSVLSLVLTLFLLRLLIDTYHVHDLIAKLITVGVGMFWNFFMNKFWTFSA